jgi:predicted nucleotidyltransferase
VAEVRWSDLSPAQYEQMVGVLISTLYPAAQKIDGAGGDGGIDIGLQTPNGLVIWELKSFVGRLASGRRRQIERSLTRALERRPIEWNLVVPVNPTPAEKKWFDDLKAEGVQLNWYGLSWLDAQMSKHPQIARYFLWNGETEAIQLLRELHQEQAALAGGVPDALRRLEALAGQLNELDPYYRFSISTVGGKPQLSVHPRFSGAEHERPILVSLEGKFPNTPEGERARNELQQTIKFGTPVRVPAEYVSRLEVDAPAGLGGTFENVAVSIASAEVPVELDARLAVTDPNGKALTSLPVRFSSRTFGMTGFVAEGADYSGVFHIELVFDNEAPSGTIHFDYHVPRDALPSAILPALQALENLRSPNRATLMFGGRPAAELELPERRWVTEGYVEVIAALSRVQSRTATYFPVPESLTVDDIEAIRTADRLLQGQRVSFRWSHMRLELGNDSAEMVRALVAEMEPRTMRIQRGLHEVTVSGHVVPLGESVLYLDSAIVANRDEVALMDAPKQDLSLELAPGTTNDGYVELLDVIKPEGARLSNVDRKLLNGVRDVIRSVEPAARLWLFGSRARGEAREAADWDVAVVLPGTMSRERRKAIGDRLYEFQIEQQTSPVIDAKIISADHWERQIGEGRLRTAVESEGISLDGG